MNRLKEMREARGLNMREAARLLKMPYTTYVNYEKGAREPNSETLIQLADFFDTTIDYMLGKTDDPNSVTVSSSDSNILPFPDMKSVPLIGTIACGEPILAAENIECEVDMPEHVKADFALRCKGDSMINARIYDGDIVYIRQQPTVDDGQIAAVLVDDEATLKRVHFYPDHVVLEPENPQYRPLSFWESDMEHVRILGKAVAFTSNVR